MTAKPDEYVDGAFRFRIFHPSDRAAATTAVIFAHGTGVPADAYQTMLAQVSRTSGAVVASYDMRGFGYSRLSYSVEKQTSLWEQAVLEHAKAAEAFTRFCSAQYPGRPLKLVLMGHSFGAWLSVKAASLVGASQVIALDPVMLPPPLCIVWASFCMFGLRRWHPISKTVLRRKAMPATRAASFEVMKRREFFKEWNDADIQAYLDAVYEWSDEGVRPRQDKRYEALVFQMQPPSTLWRFLQIPRAARRDIPFNFIIGAQSDVSNARSAWALKLIFRKFGFSVIDGGHMFPLQKIDAATVLICRYLA